MSEYIASHIKAVLFDFDDTLIGTHMAMWALHRHIAHTYYGIELTDEVILSCWGRPLDELATTYYQTNNAKEGVSRILLHQVDFPKQPFQYSTAVLQHLKSTGKLIGIVSASLPTIIRDDARLACIPLELVDYLQTAEDTSFHKPDPRVFEPALGWASEHHLEPPEILYIGDGLHDMQAATASGLNFLGVGTGLVTAEQFAEHGAQSINDLSHLI